jgi:RimJ/RimL family protein N-acetyltransferase
MSIAIRKLTAEDWRLLAEIRLQALHTDPLVFGSTYAYESTFTEEDWRKRLEPDYRGRGLSKLMYEKRIEWARAHATVRRIVVSHRASNEASKHANQKHGFIFMRSHEKTWVDGVTEDEVYYELLLDA